MKKVLLILLLSIITFSFPIFVSAATTISSCPYTISSPGNYVLSGDLSGVNNCISITSSNVSLDGWNSALGRRNKINYSGGVAFGDCDNSHNCAIRIERSNSANITITNLESNAEIIQVYTGVSNIIIKNSILKGAMFYGADDITLDNNTLNHLSIATNGIDNHDCAADMAYRFKIIGNNITTYTDSSTNGIDIAAGVCGVGCTNINIKGLIENNTMAQGVQNNLAAVYFRYGISNSTIRNNRIISKGSSGLLIRDGPSYNLIENNYIESTDNTGGSLRTHAGNEVPGGFPTKNIFRNNTFKGINAAAVNIGYGAGDSNFFENNIIWTIGTTGNAITGINGTFIHNTFYHQGSSSYVFVIDTPNTGTTLNNNIIYSNAYSNILSCPAGISVYSGNNNLFNGTPSANLCGYSLTNWKTATGDDSNSIQANPMFVNATAGNFHLQSGSPACSINGGYAGAYPCSSMQEPSCTDTDNPTYPTINYNVKGTAQSPTQSLTDSCSGAILTEYYCQNPTDNLVSNTAYTCPYGCSNGACLFQPQDTQPPVKGTNTVSPLYNGYVHQYDLVTFKTTWTDNIQLAGYILEINQFGSDNRWINLSYVKFNGISNIASYTFNVTAAFNKNPNAIGWRFWVNDTSGNLASNGQSNGYNIVYIGCTSNCGSGGGKKFLVSLENSPQNTSWIIWSVLIIILAYLVYYFNQKKRKKN